MSKLSEQKKEVLEFLDGVEFQSLNYEGCVGIYKTNVYRDGEVVDTLDTDAKVDAAWDEYVEGEGL